MIIAAVGAGYILVGAAFWVWMMLRSGRDRTKRLGWYVARIPWIVPFWPLCIVVIFDIRND